MSSINQKKPRSSGVLMHPTSLPGSPVCGSFGEPSRNWINFLSDNGIGVWQFLPLSPTDKTGSPYSSPSSFALNPFFLDVNDLVEEGFIIADSKGALPGEDVLNNSSVDFFLADIRSTKLGELLRNNWSNQSKARNLEFNEWCISQFWLEDHANFMQLRRQFNDLPWWKWPDSFAKYDVVSLMEWRKNNEDNLLEHKLLQWHLYRQWLKIKHLANNLGVVLFGDMPFYVATDSADVWSKRSLFSINEIGKLEIQSGVPPDYFSETGQLWGTPVYSWKEHYIDNFEWWRSRFKRHWEQVDILRLDHFRALKAYWAVKGDDNTAQRGQWIDSPGQHLLRLLQIDFKGNLPLIAEDLGVIDESVESLRDEFKLPGMKILQFAFDNNKDNPYLPENINGNNWVVYTGTHDNPTTNSWWNDLEEDVKKSILDRSTNSNKSFISPAYYLIEMGINTEAGLFISPIQDLLGLDDQARFNKPGTIGNNWQWRIKDFNTNIENTLQFYGHISTVAGRKAEDAVKIFR